MANLLTGVTSLLKKTLLKAPKSMVNKFDKLKSVYDSAKANTLKTLDSSYSAIGKSTGMEFARQAKQNVTGTRPYKIGKGISSFGASALKNVATGLADNKYKSLGAISVVGIGVGGARAVVNRSNERTQMANKRNGMAANNLGTDGLTLALSRRRHM